LENNVCKLCIIGIYIYVIYILQLPLSKLRVENMISLL